MNSNHTMLLRPLAAVVCLLVLAAAAQPASAAGKKCGPIPNGECAPGEYCMHKLGTCGLLGNLGVCKVKPTVCPALHDPVCGCDKQTYDNSCAAARAGVSVDHKGKCRA